MSKDARQQRIQQAQTLHEASVIVATYRKDDTETVARLQALAEEIAARG